jgi:hypothetical protein
MKLLLREREFQVVNHSPEVKTENHWRKRSPMDDIEFLTEKLVMMSPIKRM